LLEARRRGEVAFSRDLGSASAVAAAVVALMVGGPALVLRLVAYQRAALGAAAAGGDPGPALAAGLAVGARVLAWPLVTAAAVALGLGLLQTRGLVVPEALAPDLGRLSVAAGWRRLGGGGRTGEVGRGLLALVVMAAVATAALSAALPALAALPGAPASRVWAALGVLGRALAGRLALVGVAAGVVDYLVRRSRHLRALRMTRDEVRREQRETEGDPARRAERRRLHREAIAQQGMEAVRTASVVLTAPGGLVVALRYTSDAPAPIVVARGERLVGRRIEEVARAAGVAVRVAGDEVLARVLGELAPGDEIPPAVYDPVAEILRVVRGPGF